METRVYLYEGAQVTFRSENGLMVNANEMAKIFSKKPNDYLRLDSTKEFFAAWQAENQTAGNPVVTKEGKNGGTWMHEDIALDFAQWLSPKFRVWCNARLRELMQHGITATGETLEKLIANPELVAGMAAKLIEERAATAAERAARLRAEESLQIAATTLQKQASIVKYATEVLDSNTLIKTTIIAQQLGMSAERLNKKLADAGIQFRQGKDWVLYTKWVDKGLAGMKTYTFPKPDGTTGTSQQLQWTEAGRKFILERFAQR